MPWDTTDDAAYERRKAELEAEADARAAAKEAKRRERIESGYYDPDKLTQIRKPQ